MRAGSPAATGSSGSGGPRPAAPGGRWLLVGTAHRPSTPRKARPCSSPASAAIARPPRRAAAPLLAAQTAAPPAAAARRLLTMMRPRVSRPTGTLIGSPVSTTRCPRVRPSVASMAMQRTVWSPTCCAGRAASKRAAACGAAGQHGSAGLNHVQVHAGRPTCAAIKLQIHAGPAAPAVGPSPYRRPPCQPRAPTCATSSTSRISCFSTSSADRMEGSSPSKCTSTTAPITCRPGSAGGRAAAAVKTAARAAAGGGGGLGPRRAPGHPAADSTARAIPCARPGAASGPRSGPWVPSSRAEHDWVASGGRTQAPGGSDGAASAPMCRLGALQGALGPQRRHQHRSPALRAPQRPHRHLLACVIVPPAVSATAAGSAANFLTMERALGRPAAAGAAPAGPVSPRAMVASMVSRMRPGDAQRRAFRGDDSVAKQVPPQPQLRCVLRSQRCTAGSQPIGQ